MLTQLVHTATACSIFWPHGPACIIEMDMHHGHEHAMKTWTCSIEGTGILHGNEKLEAKRSKKIGPFISLKRAKRVRIVSFHSEKNSKRNGLTYSGGFRTHKFQCKRTIFIYIFQAISLGNIYYKTKFHNFLSKHFIKGIAAPVY
jgi:hypothetical protein